MNVPITLGYLGISCIVIGIFGMLAIVILGVIDDRRWLNEANRRVVEAQCRLNEWDEAQRKSEGKE